MASTLLFANSYPENTGNTTLLCLYGGAISNAFANAGWLRSAQGGQIDWTSVTGNASMSANFGYEIWQMNDSLQNTTPIYLKIAYRSGAAQANTPAFQFQIGSGTDGAGNLIGVTSVVVVANTQLANPTAQPCFFVGTSSRLAMALWTTATPDTGCMFFSIERTHDAGGNDTVAGAMMSCYAYNNNSLGSQIYWSPLGTPGNATENYGVFATTLTSTGNVLQVYPQYYCDGLFTNPSLNIIWAVTGTVTPYAPVSIPFYGATRQYLPTFIINSASYRTGTLNLQPMILWE
jgi:hypothetical protein